MQTVHTLKINQLKKINVEDCDSLVQISVFVHPRELNPQILHEEN